jgi:hypothetical protein
MELKLPLQYLRQFKGPWPLMNVDGYSPDWISVEKSDSIKLDQVFP